MTVALASTVTAQTPPGPVHPTTSCFNGEKWSTLHGGAAAGAFIHILPNTTVILDMDTPDLGGIFVEGNLVFDDLSSGPRVLSSAYILVTGVLQIGCGRDLPQLSKAKIVLCDQTPLWTGTAAESSFLNAASLPVKNACLDRGLVVTRSGQLLLYGEDRVVSWCKLDTTAAAGAQSLDLNTAVQGFWKSGMTVAIAASQFDDSEAEEAVITTFTATDKPQLAAPLQNEHLSFEEVVQSGTGWSLPMRTEVGLLPRSISIEGESNGSPTPHYGHVILMKDPANSSLTPWCDVSWTEFHHLGIEGALGRYPFHLHMLGDARHGGTYPPIFEDNSIHHCFHRFLAIHNTKYVSVQRNVGYDTLGHGFYFEYENMEPNVHPTEIDFKNNLGFGVRMSAIGILPSDVTEPAVYYVEHPNNRISGNHAAGSEGHGFYLAPQDYASYTHTNTGSQSYFKDNVAHSCQRNGFYQNTRPDWNYTGATSDNPTAEGLDAWKCRQYGVWWRTRGVAHLKRFRIADCRAGIYPATEGLQDAGADFTGQIQIRDFLIIGESQDHGSMAAKVYPQTTKYFEGHALPWDVLAGIELYDGHNDVEDVRFAHFKDATIQSDLRSAGPFTQVAYESQYSENPQNRLRQCEFFDEDSRVFFRIFTTLPNMVRNTVVLDEDGSIGGPSWTDTYYAVRTAALVANHHGAFGEPNGDTTEGWYRLKRADAPFAQVTVTGSGGNFPPDKDFIRVSLKNWASATVTQTVRNASESGAKSWPFNGIIDNLATPDRGVYYCSFDSSVLSNAWPTQYQIKVQFAESTGQKIIVGVRYSGSLPNQVNISYPTTGSVPQVTNQNGDSFIDLQDLLLVTNMPHAYAREGNVIYILTTTGLDPGTTLLPQGTHNLIWF